MRRAGTRQYADPRQRGQKHPPARAIAIDVDGTLIINGVVNTDLIEWCRRRQAEGYELMLWSAQGREYAEAAAGRAGITDMFTVICSKPGYIVDDRGWDWIKYTRHINLDESKL